MDRIISFFLGVSTTLIFIILLLGIKHDADLIEIIKSTSSLAILISVIIALRTYLLTRSKHEREIITEKSQQYLDESKLLLERAYEIFTQGKDEVPVNDRLVWLTTARLLTRYDLIKCGITETPQKDILKEHEEYWRHKFYALLNKNKDKLNLNYFMPNSSIYDGENINRKSIAIIFGFSKWKSNTDPIAHINDKAIFASGVVPIDFTGVESYLSQHQGYWEEVQQLKAATNTNSTPDLCSKSPSESNESSIGIIQAWKKLHSFEKGQIKYGLMLFTMTKIAQFSSAKNVIVDVLVESLSAISLAVFIAGLIGLSIASHKD